MTLAGKVAFVAGAEGGIGRAASDALARAGARVVASSRAGAAPSDEVLAAGGSAVALDLGDAVAIGRVACELLGRLGRGPDILVYAAGAFGLAPIPETPVELLDRQIEVNLRAPFLLTRALLPSMRELESGRIILLGSIAGRVAFSRNGAYAASKYGLRGFHEVLLAESAGTSVAPTLIEPGAVDTALWDGLDPDGDPELPDRGSMLSTEDLAEAILFVASRPPSVRIPYLPVHPS